MGAGINPLRAGTGTGTGTGTQPGMGPGWPGTGSAEGREPPEGPRCEGQPPVLVGRSGESGLGLSFRVRGEAACPVLGVLRQKYNRRWAWGENRDVKSG